MENFIKKFFSLRIFSILSLFLFVLWLIFLFSSKTSSVQACLFFDNLHAFGNTFADFIEPIRHTLGNLVYEHLVDTVKGQCCYPPFAFLVFNFFANFIQHVNYTNIYNIASFLVSIFLTLTTLSLFFLFKNNIKANNKIDKILLCFALIFSHIFLYTYERGNLILTALLFLAFYIFYYDSKNKILKELSLISLALAAAIKISPAIFGLLLIYKKDYKSAFRLFFYAAAFFILPTLFFPRGIETLLTFKENILIFSKNMLYTKSLYAVSVGKGYLTGFFGSIFPIEAVNRIINYIVYGIIGFELFCSFFYKEYWRKILVLTLALIFIPSVSSFYVLIYLFPVIILFFNEKEEIKNKNFYFISFLLILCPIQLVIGKFNYSLAIKHIIVLLMLCCEFLYAVSFLKNKNWLAVLKLNADEIIKKIAVKSFLKTCTLCAASFLIFSFGMFAYNKNYQNLEIGLNDNFNNEAQVKLKNGFIINADVTFKYESNDKPYTILEISEKNKGIKIGINANDKLFINVSNDQNININVLEASLKNKKKYNLKMQVTNKTIATVINDPISTYADSENVFSLNKNVIHNIKIADLNDDDKAYIVIKNGNNSSLIVILTFLLSFIPLFMIFYYPKKKEN